MTGLYQLKEEKTVWFIDTICFFPEAKIDVGSSVDSVVDVMAAIAAPVLTLTTLLPYAET